MGIFFGIINSKPLKTLSLMTFVVEKMSKMNGGLKQKTSSNRWRTLSTAETDIMLEKDF